MNLFFKQALTKLGDKWECHFYVRSEPNSRRDRDDITTYAVGVGENTAFDTAIQPNPTGISHFFGPDLPKMKKDHKYRNKRDDFEKYYRSAIVVPIRFKPEPIQVSMTNTRGFLSVDTLSTWRLNSGSHVELLASVADQMYNFFSLMRGTYRLPSTTDEGEETV